MVGGTPRMPLPLVSDAIVQTVAEHGLAAALARYEEIRSNQGDAYEGGSMETEIDALGRAALALHDTDVAIEIFKLGVELSPNSWRAYRSLGDAYRAAGAMEEADRFATIAREVRERESTIMAHVRSGAFEEARRVIARAHEGGPGLQLVMPARIGPYFDEVFLSGDLAEALEICRVWALADPGAVGPYFSMARVYRAQEDTERLKATYEHILEMQPDGPAAETARRALAELGGGLL